MRGVDGVVDAVGFEAKGSSGLQHRGLHGRWQLGHGPRRWLIIRLDAAFGRTAVGPDGDRASGGTPRHRTLDGLAQARHASQRAGVCSDQPASLQSLSVRETWTGKSSTRGRLPVGYTRRLLVGLAPLVEPGKFLQTFGFSNPRS